MPPEFLVALCSDLGKVILTANEPSSGDFAPQPTPRPSQSASRFVSRMPVEPARGGEADVDGIAVELPPPLTSAPSSAFQASDPPIKTASSSATTEAPRARPLFQVLLSPIPFALVWVLMLGFHVGCAVYYAFMAKLYYYFVTTRTTQVLIMSQLAIALTEFKKVGAVHAAVAAMHVVCVGYMVYSSIRCRRLSFRPPPATAPSRLSLYRSSIIGKLKSKQSMVPVRAQHGPSNSPVQQIKRMVTARANLVLELLGVEYEHFDTVFLVRAIGQIALQTLQGVLMSLYITRYWLSNVITFLILLNCFSPLLVELVVRNKSVPFKRLVLILCQMTIDFFSTIVVPIALFCAYYKLFDPVTTDFFRQHYYNNFWRTTLLSEFHTFWVQSWFNLVVRVSLAINLISGLEICKSLIGHKDTTKGNATAPVPIPTPVYTPWQRRALQTSRVLLFAWGVVVLGLHVYATSRPLLAMCGLQVRPWLLRSKPSCAAMRVDCAVANITGQRDEITPVLEQLDERTLVALNIVHCSALDVPPAIRSFPKLRSVSVSTSTLRNWDVDAALTNVTHPELTTVSFTRTTNISQLPPGLVTDLFPSTVTNIEWSSNDLTVVPLTLYTKWSGVVALYLENMNLTAFPISFLHNKLRAASVADNKITALPVALFRIPWMITINLCGNPLQTLPELPPNTTLMHGFRLFIESTNVTSLPAWVDAKFFASGGEVHAASTPLCTRLQAQNASMQTPIDKKVMCAPLPFMWRRFIEMTLIDRLNNAKTGKEYTELE